MKQYFLILILGFHFLSAFTQTHSGHIIDASFQKAVPFANIGIIGKNIGTVSDAEGAFKLELSDNFDKDTLCFSCVGYESRKYSISDFKDEIGDVDRIEIKLSPKTYQLSEVLVRPVETRIYTLGNFCDSNSCYGNSFRSGKLGTEIGVLMELPRKAESAYLKSLRFYVGDFTFDEFPVRLNIYNLKNGLPHQNILKEPIFVDIRSDGEYIIDLAKYNILTSGDFFISLEYYRVHGLDDGKLTFCAVHNRKVNKGNGYYRLTSQGNWMMELGDNLGFSVVVECER